MVFKSLVFSMALVTAIPCFSQDNVTSKTTIQLEDNRFIDLGMGIGHVISDSPETALAYFEKAVAKIPKSDESFCMSRFIIFLGEATAYDMLGMRNECKQTLGSLLLFGKEYEDFFDENDEDDEEINLSEEENALFQLIHKMVSKAPSQDVRNLLLSILED